MSWSSRVIRARSSATAIRAAVSRSRSASAARSSAASACSARVRSAKPASQRDREQGGDEDEVTGLARRVVVGDDGARRRARSTRPIRPCAASRRLPSRNAAASPATIDAERGDDERAVHERARRREQPQRGRGGERPPATERAAGAPRPRPPAPRTTATWSPRPRAPPRAPPRSRRGRSGGRARSGARGGSGGARCRTYPSRGRAASYRGRTRRLTVARAQPPRYSSSVTWRPQVTALPLSSTSCIARCVMNRSGAAPCQWFSPGSK